MVARNLEVKVATQIIKSLSILGLKGFFYNGRVQVISGLFIGQLLGVDTKLYFFALSLGCTN